MLALNARQVTDTHVSGSASGVAAGSWRAIRGEHSTRGHKHCNTSTNTHTTPYSFSLVYVWVLAQIVLVLLDIQRAVLRVLFDEVTLGGTYLMSVTLETSQLPMSWLNDEAVLKRLLKGIHAHQHRFQQPLSKQNQQAVQIQMQIQIHTRYETTRTTMSASASVSASVLDVNVKCQASD